MTSQSRKHVLQTSQCWEDSTNIRKKCCCVNCLTDCSVTQHQCSRETVYRLFDYCTVPAWQYAYFTTQQQTIWLYSADRQDSNINNIYWQNRASDSLKWVSLSYTQVQLRYCLLALRKPLLYDVTERLCQPVASTRMLESDFRRWMIRK